MLLTYLILVTNTSTKHIQSFALVDTVSKSPSVIEIDAENWKYTLVMEYSKGLYKNS
jgi:hypothetical protein